MRKETGNSVVLKIQKKEVTIEDLVLQCRKQIGTKEVIKKVKVGKKIKIEKEIRNIYTIVRQDIFKQIVNQFEPMMHKLISQITTGSFNKNSAVFLTKEDKEDLLNSFKEATVRAVNKFNKEKKVTFFTYLYRACYNEAVTFTTALCENKEAKDRVVKDIYDIEITKPVKEETQEELDKKGRVFLPVPYKGRPSEQRGFLESLEKNMIRKKLIESIRDPKTRIAVSKLLKGESIQDIATHLECSTVRVRNRIKSIKKEKHIQKLYQEIETDF